MKPLHTIAFASGALAATAIMTLVPLFVPRDAHAAVVRPIEQYLIVSSRYPNSSAYKMDDEIERELNTLAIDGWRVRAVNHTAIVMAR